MDALTTSRVWSMLHLVPVGWNAIRGETVVPIGGVDTLSGVVAALGNSNSTAGSTNKEGELER